MAEEPGKPGKPTTSGGLVKLCTWCSERKGIPVPQKHGLHERRNWGRITRWWECQACGNRIPAGAETPNQYISQ
jgi:hypothetical protein